ncbi:hypothetical protein BJY52DRAFT_1223688 [Lactarius psammicola]|nr:hypothetical protein BJY52DRAFT_1223688 [Lactarius psammicola]
MWILHVQPQTQMYIGVAERKRREIVISHYNPFLEFWGDIVVDTSLHSQKNKTEEYIEAYIAAKEKWDERVQDTAQRAQDELKFIDMFRTQSLPFTHEYNMIDMIAPPPSSVSSPSTQMPTVFVHPPEEEQEESQPWCAFDASKENIMSGVAFTTPEMDVLVSKLDIWSQTAHPTAEPAPSSHRTQTDIDVFISRQDSLGPSPSGSSSNPLGLASIPESPKRHKERDDDDIVEVMKVRRSEGMPDVAYAHGTVPVFRRPKTLRSRAAQALRSIKNVGKVPRRSALEHVFPAKENNGHAAKPSAPAHAPAWTDKHAKVLPTQPSTPLLKKRVSQPLSNLFSLGQGAPTSSSSAPSDPAPPTPSPSGRFRTMPHSRGMSATLSTSASTSALHLPTDGPARPTSPSFTIGSTRHKFSFVNLQSIFSGNVTVPHEPEREPEPESELGSEPVATTADAETDPELPRTVQTPVDDGWDSDEDYDSPRRHANLGTTARRPVDESPSLEQQEFSFEMRLNSLHFDSFSFDADAF